MYMYSFLVTWRLSDRWKQFFLQQIVVSKVPWWALTYPEKGILAINLGWWNQPINFTRNLIYKEAERIKQIIWKVTKDKRNDS